MGKIDFENMDHHEFYQASIRAIKSGVEDYPQATMEEHSTYFIALTNAVLALYLLLKEEYEREN
jgi:hypothetical protein